MSEIRLAHRRRETANLRELMWINFARAGLPHMSLREGLRPAREERAMTELSANTCGITRRTVLLGCIAGGTAALATGASALEMSPVKVSKDCVHFQTVAHQGHTCGACKLFAAPSSCIAVSGDIGRDCGCRIWLPKSV